MTLYIPKNIIYPGWMLLEKRISKDARSFYGILNGLANSNGYAFGSDEDFAKLLKVSERTIQRWFENLEEYTSLRRDTKMFLRDEKEPKNSKGNRWKKERKIYIGDDQPKKDYEPDKSGDSIEPDKSGDSIEPDKSGGYNLKSLKRKTEEEERASSLQSKKTEEEDKSFFERLNNTNFLLINMNSEDRNLLAKRGGKLTAKEWDNVCLRFIQRSKVIDINPVVPYFQTLITAKAEPQEEDYKKETERKLLEKQDDIQEKTLQVKMLKDTYQVPNFWNPEAGHLIEMRISPMFFEYKFRDMKQHSRVLYEDANFYIKLSEIKKLIELLTY